MRPRMEVPSSGEVSILDVLLAAKAIVATVFIFEVFWGLKGVIIGIFWFLFCNWKLAYIGRFGRMS